MSSQAALIDETIVGLKRALLRHAAYDDAINQPSNRGNKTKLNAEFVREGALGYMNHEQFYRKQAEHSGYKRDILETNPPRYDAEGDELDFDDSDAIADADAAEDNPFAATHLDDLLSPLTHPSELANHSMANAYTNKAITIMIERINRRLRLERHALWQAKNVYRQLVTDSIWMPCGAVELEEDRDIFGPPPSAIGLASTSPANGASTSRPVIGHQEGTLSVPKPMGEGVASPTQNVTCTKTEQQGVKNGNAIAKENNKTRVNGSLSQASHGPLSPPQGPHEGTPMDLTDRHEQGIADQEGFKAGHKDGSASGQWDDGQSTTTLQRESSPGEGEAADDGSPHPPRRMTTRAQASQAMSAQEQKDDGQLPLNQSTNNGDGHHIPLEVDPVFRLPRIARDDRNCGLSQNEADETRRMLWAYIQKQGESVRLFTEMLEMLRKSRRMKEEVWEWCKAEAHIGEMSDGEDWYDKDRWGLAEGEDLRKGADEEETEGVEEGRPAGKRGRGRRA
ncbi:uncharacterized protein GIQ15_05646 [Arthroderma uncinatum]|uniref:uncharacterized protein n=1 Tax=Arthroderma uncinatum TaxID=74035 RepID=UPI00144AF9AE|nr:uncharacterized protein GIQ15_05646 [Arthroderma uncinatum]KAF3480299.1 hypothetical protein GIQ15_05646 [Arthroderma uncinatum]